MSEPTRETAVPGVPPAQGLYDPAHEHDACGVGFVVDIAGRRSHAIVTQALTVLKNLLHRGACGCEVNTGDGAGILIQMPHRFLQRECGRLGIDLPAPGHYGAGLVFLPRAAEDRAACRSVLERIAVEEGQIPLGWRPVPTDSSPVGPTARSVEPRFEQFFIGRGAEVPDRAAQVRLTTTTGVAVSAAVNSRPSRTGIPIAAKYPGEAMYQGEDGSEPPRGTGRSTRLKLLVLPVFSSGRSVTNPAAITPGSDAVSCSSCCQKRSVASESG